MVFTSGVVDEWPGCLLTAGASTASLLVWNVLVVGGGWGRGTLLSFEGSGDWFLVWPGWTVALLVGGWWLVWAGCL